MLIASSPQVFNPPYRDCPSALKNALTVIVILQWCWTSMLVSRACLVCCHFTQLHHHFCKDTSRLDIKLISLLKYIFWFHHHLHYKNNPEIHIYAMFPPLDIVYQNLHCGKHFLLIHKSIMPSYDMGGNSFIFLVSIACLLDWAEKQQIEWGWPLFILYHSNSYCLIIFYLIGAVAGVDWSSEVGHMMHCWEKKQRPS